MDTRDLLTDEEPSGFQRLLGYRLVEWGEGHAALELDVDQRHLNRAGVLHGGVLTTLIDTVCGFASTWTPEPGKRRLTVTLSLTTAFTGQVSEGTVRAVGRKVGGGRKIYACTAEVIGPDGAVVAVGQGSFRYRPGSEG